MPSPHAAPQYSLIHRSVLCPVHTLTHSIHSYIALSYAQSTRCPTVFTHPSLCPMSSPHAFPQHSILHRSALRPVQTLPHSIHTYIALPYAQSTRCPSVFTLSSLCLMPSPHAVPQPVLPQSDLVLPLIQSMECTFLNPIFVILSLYALPGLPQFHIYVGIFTDLSDVTQKASQFYNTNLFSQPPPLSLAISCTTRKIHFAI
jgi:hypothetical protein